MQLGKPSRTAWAAAAHCAAHQVLEQGCIFADPLALRILGKEVEAIALRAKEHPSGRRMRISEEKISGRRCVHARKDAFSQRRPGINHRKVRHHKYQMFGRNWDFSDPFPQDENARVKRIVRWKGAVIAEEYMASVSHDVDDRTWDFEGSSRADRAAIRKYWESLCAWLVLSPQVLKSWSGVDVTAGKIHRVVDGVEVWEDEPTLIPAYTALRNRVRFLVCRDRSSEKLS